MCLRAICRWMILAGACLACAGAPESAPPLLRVGTSGDYPPFSVRSERGADGFDVAVARAWAAERGWRLELVPFRWPDLLLDLQAGRFDVAMSGVTIRPERSVAGRFSVPVARSEAVVLVPATSAVQSPAALDRREVALAVNAGGHLEQVARSRFPHARLLPLSPNSAVLDALLAGEVAGAVTDSLEAPHWMAGENLRALGPLSRDRKGYLLRAGLPELARDLDRWLLAHEADGSLAALRRRYLGEAGPPEAEPLHALLAAADERLALMPAVAEAKRREGRPVEAPDVEERVLAAAAARLRAAERRQGAARTDEAAFRDLVRAQIEAAKAVQRHVLAGPPEAGAPAFSLEELRPALLRIGDRIAELVAQLPSALDPAEVQRGVREEVAAPGLEDAQREALVEALLRLRPQQQPDQQADDEGDRDARAVAQEREAQAQDRHLPGDEAL
jgi:cyclohexadienyl dehydratase